MAKRDRLKELVTAAARPSDPRTYNTIKREALSLTTERNWLARVEEQKRAFAAQRA